MKGKITAKQGVFKNPGLFPIDWPMGGDPLLKPGHCPLSPGDRPVTRPYRSAMGNITFYRQPVRNRPGQRHFIGIFQFSAKGNTPGNGGDFHGVGRQPFLYKVDGGISLNIRVKGKYDFFDLLFLDPVNQGVDGQLLRTDPVQGGNHAPEYMIGTTKLLGGFNGDNIPDRLHHADHVFPAQGIGADGTDIRIGHIVATLAKPDFLPHFKNGFPESPGSGRILLQEVKHQAQGRLLADTGQSGKFIYSRLQ